MTAGRDNSAAERAPATPATISRRMLVRGASVAVPTILTLNSTAAVGWAIASNTIGTKAATGDQGDVLCLDLGSTGDEVKPGVYALGDPPYAEVIKIPSSNEYRSRVGGTGQPTTIYPEDVCLDGGYIEYKGDGDWTPLKTQPLPPGALVSNAAVASFGSRIFGRNITEL